MSKLIKESREYPREVWVLMPSFKPVKVEVVKNYGSRYSDYGDLTAKGKLYPVPDMFESLDEAIKAGRTKLRLAKADIEKRQNTLEKKIAALDKAEAEASK